MKQWVCALRLIVALAMSAALGACGGGDSGDSSGSTPPVTVTIGGSVTGLTGTLVLRNNGANDLTLSRDGAFIFSAALGTGVAYDVTVATQPANETCVIAKGSGTTGSSNVTDVSVTCSTGGAVTPPTALSYPSPQSYIVGVQIAPLNPTVTGTVTSYSVSPALPAGLSLDSSTGRITGTPNIASAATSYLVTATNGGGSATFSLAIAVNTPQSDFTVGGTVTGLSGAGLVLRNNNGDDLKVTANGAVTFSSALASGAAYLVTVKTQPVRPGQLCSVTNGSGTIGNANVTDVAINCVGSSFIDTDRDGLTDEIEAILGTDPTKVDCDGDGIADGEEVLLRRTDPLKTDTDADGAADNAEVVNGTDPNDVDTDGDSLTDASDPYPWRADGDGDGLPDEAEFARGTDPLKRDTDGSGASDGWEVLAGTDPLIPGDDGVLLRSPQAIDSDADGLTDGEEAALGTDSHDPDTDGDRVGDFNDATLCVALNPDTDGDGLDDLEDRALGITMKCDLGVWVHDGLIDSAEVGPTVRDQDSDGLIDGVEEYVYHSFSGVQDTDNDGLKDGDEVNLHRTDPISADTDCDGVTDGQEISAGTDPLHGPGGSTCTL